MISEIEETGVKVTEAQKNALTGVPEAIEEARAAVDEAIASNGEVDPAAAIANATEQSAQLVKDAAAGAVTEAAETAAEEAESQGKAAGESLVSSAADGITASVGEVTAAAQEIGSAIDQGVAAAIRAGTGEVVEAGRGMIRQTMGGMRWEAEIKSPSRKARNLIGKPLAQGVGVGFEQETPNVVRVVRRSTERLISGAAAVARRGSYTVPATAAPAAAGINYDAMGSAMERAMGRVRFGFNVGDRDLAQATREANAQQLAVQSRRVANRYGG
jgi:hypothetical protein